MLRLPAQSKIGVLYRPGFSRSCAAVTVEEGPGVPDL
jgi:hypothetical protein